MTDQELNIACAERMGYQFKDEGARYPDEEDWQKYKAVYSPGGGFIGLCKPDWLQVPDFPGCMNAAMQLVERARKQGYSLMLDNYSSTDVWEAKFIEDFHSITDLDALDKSPAKAVCLAFLKLPL